MSEEELSPAELEKKQEDEICIELYQKHVVDGISQVKLAEEYKLTAMTVSRKIKKGKKLILETLNTSIDDMKADVFSRYDWLYKKLKIIFEQTQDLNALKQMMTILEQQRKMFSLDLPTKAPVNEKGESQQLQINFNFDGSGYEALERKQLNPEIVDGKVREIVP